MTDFQIPPQAPASPAPAPMSSAPVAEATLGADWRNSAKALQAYRTALTAQFFFLIIIAVVLVLGLKVVEDYNRRHPLASPDPSASSAATKIGVASTAAGTPAPLSTASSSSSSSAPPASAASAVSADKEPNPLPVFLCVVLVGALGALVSALQRLYKIESLPAALLNPLPDFNTWHLWMYSMIPPIIGMVSASFFYLLAVTELLQGTLLVHFTCARAPDCNGSMGGLMAYSPSGPQDYAKALVMGFLAGFAERLMPDMLSSLEGALKKPQRGQ